MYLGSRSKSRNHLYHVDSIIASVFVVVLGQWRRSRSGCLDSLTSKASFRQEIHGTELQMADEPTFNLSTW